mmetsp:Transcript_24584/g.48395  ORF Transcript_24584/g.48395 Transcript_24584/m.48395 type:complete len:222 (+) Transcript_24584:897-1562(+)
MRLFSCSSRASCDFSKAASSLPLLAFPRLTDCSLTILATLCLACSTSALSPSTSLSSFSLLLKRSLILDLRSLLSFSRTLSLALLLSNFFLMIVISYTVVSCSAHSLSYSCLLDSCISCIFSACRSNIDVLGELLLPRTAPSSLAFRAAAFFRSRTLAFRREISCALPLQRPCSSNTRSKGTSSPTSFCKARESLFIWFLSSLSLLRAFARRPFRTRVISL